jgi:hypothetical protein
MGDKSVHGGHAKKEPAKTLKEKRHDKADKKAAADRSDKTDVVAKVRKH